MNSHSVDHKQLFRSFCELELKTGGPDPQVEIAARAGYGEAEPGWLAGCFVVPYTVGAAAALYAHVSRRAALENFEMLVDTVKEHWAGLPVRRERRSVWKPEKLAECLASYARWSQDTLPTLADASYDVVWKSVRDELRYFGRYAGMKLIEVLHRQGLVAASQYDIRADGAWSPRKTLGLLASGELSDLGVTAVSKSNSQEVLWTVERLATHEYGDLSFNLRLSTPASWFQFETLLCNYRQALSGKYPGRSHDRELAHFRKAEEYWGPDLSERGLPFYTIRQEAFDNRCLGEVNGWNGARKDLERVFADHGYMWCDTEYNYVRTTNLSDPVAWT